ncbi:pentapeptide repeat-containing protein [Geodermatophilus sp. SYSU D01176]
MATWWQRIPRRWRGLLATIAAGVLVLIVLWGGPWLLTRHPNSGVTAEQELKAKSDVRATLVQAVGGLAVAGGLIVSYRTFQQSQREQKERGREQDRTYALNLAAQVTDTYTKAVAQLGHEQAPVRLGALYSLESLAQDNPERRQTVVDVLCAYLRMPHTPAEQDGSGATVSASPASRTDARNAAQELQVRRAAQRLLAEHLHRPAGMSGEEAQTLEASPGARFWPGIDLDLTGATLHESSFSDASVVQGEFSGATFFGRAEFSRAAFSGDASFEGATFADDAEFEGATFSGRARFNQAEFSGRAWFVQATFSGDAGFDGATVVGDAGFDDAEFAGDAGFDSATFSGNAGLGGATFSGGAWFGGAVFAGDAWFTGATFRGGASFTDTEFCGSIVFDRARFDGHAQFGRATFSADARFTDVRFLNGASLDAVRVLHLDDEEMNRSGTYARRVWPDGWTVHRDTYEPTCGALVLRDGEQPHGQQRAVAEQVPGQERDQ